MNLDKLPQWLRGPVGAIAGLGGFGIFVVAFLDSSFIPLPVINDLVIINNSIMNPARMPYYALMATLGSVAGCVLLYFLARKGGEALFRKRAGTRGETIRAWLEKNGFVSLLMVALLPPPMPFKVVIIGAGVFQVPLRSFVLALLLARSIRYFGEGYLAVRYGDLAMHYMTSHKLEFTLISLATVAVMYLAVKLALRAMNRPA
jgi:membrane protein YqaA with SNARE-associated domain